MQKIKITTEEADQIYTELPEDAVCIGNEAEERRLYASAIIGVAQVGDSVCVFYSYDRLLPAILEYQKLMSLEEAADYCSYNVMGGLHFAGAPIIVMED